MNVVVELSGSGGDDDGDDSDGERGRVDEEFARPAVRQVIEELLEQSDGQLSLSQLSSRLVQENVLTPFQARRRSAWLAREATSVLEEGAGSGGDDSGNSGSSEELEAPPSKLGDGDEDGEEDVFASMSQLFNLDSSDSSETKRRKTVPLSLSQQVDDSDQVPDAAPNAPGTQGPASQKERARKRGPQLVPLGALEPGEREEEMKARRRRYRKRVRTFVRWQREILPPVWPDGVRTALCSGCGERELSDRCQLELCDTCCRERASGECGEHRQRTDRDCAGCRSGRRLKGCPYGRCRDCCVFHPGGACPLHLREGRVEDVRRMTLGRHVFPASHAEQMRRRVAELYMAWRRGDFAAVCRDVAWLARRRGYERGTKNYVSPLELCAFALGAAERQPRASADFMQNMRARCYEWLDAAQVFAEGGRGTPATGLLHNDVLAALETGNCSLPALESLLELRLFSTARLRALIGYAHERAAAAAVGVSERSEERAKAAEAYRTALAAEGADEREKICAAAGLMRVHVAEGTVPAGTVVVRELCKRMGHPCPPLLLLYTRHAGLEAAGEGEEQTHLFVLRFCPTWEPSLEWMCRHRDTAPATVHALMRALLVARNRETLWTRLKDVLRPRETLETDALCTFFVEELFTYCEEPPKGTKAAVEKLLLRLLV